MFFGTSFPGSLTCHKKPGLDSKLVKLKQPGEPFWSPISELEPHVYQELPQLDHMNVFFVLSVVSCFIEEI